MNRASLRERCHIPATGGPLDWMWPGPSSPGNNPRCPKLSRRRRLEVPVVRLTTRYRIGTRKYHRRATGGISVWWITHNDVHLIYAASFCQRARRKNIRAGSQRVHEHCQPGFVHTWLLDRVKDSVHIMDPPSDAPLPCGFVPDRLGRHPRRTASRIFEICPLVAVRFLCRRNRQALLEGTKGLVLGRVRASGSTKSAFFWYRPKRQACPHPPGDQTPRPMMNLIPIPILWIRTKTRNPPRLQALWIPAPSVSPWPASHPLGPTNYLPRQRRTKIQKRKQLFSSSFCFAFERFLR